MADEPNDTSTVDNQPNQPAPNADPNKATTPASPAPADAIKMAEDLGKARQEAETLRDYQKRVDPFLETVQGLDEKTKNILIDAHNKRLGITPTDAPADSKGAEEPAKPSPIEIDNRNAHIKLTVDTFSASKGIDKMEKEAQTEMNARVGAELREMLDPMGNKSLQQIMETVSVTKLPQYLEKAWFLATRNEQIDAAKKEGAQEAVNGGLGVIGSLSSASTEASDVTLTAKEKDIARKQGISEDKYLENKKEIISRDGQLF